MLQDASQREHPESGHETDYQGRRCSCHRLWLLGRRSDGRSAPCHGDVRQYENRDARRHAARVSLDEPARLPSGRGKFKDRDQSEVWLLETSSPVNLARVGGWSETAMKPGDRVSVELNPHREV